MSEFYSSEKSRKCAVRVHNNSKNETQLASNTIDPKKYIALFEHMLASSNTTVKLNGEENNARHEMMATTMMMMMMMNNKRRSFFFNWNELLGDGTMGTKIPTENNNSVKSVIWNQTLYTFTGSNNNEMIVLICSLTSTASEEKEQESQNVNETMVVACFDCCVRAHTLLSTCPISVAYLKLSKCYFLLWFALFPNYFTLFHALRGFLFKFFLSFGLSWSFSLYIQMFVCMSRLTFIVCE